MRACSIYYFEYIAYDVQVMACGIMVMVHRGGTFVYSLLFEQQNIWNKWLEIIHDLLSARVT